MFVKDIEGGLCLVDGHELLCSLQDLVSHFAQAGFREAKVLALL